MAQNDSDSGDLGNCFPETACRPHNVCSTQDETIVQIATRTLQTFEEITSGPTRDEQSKSKSVFQRLFFLSVLLPSWSNKTSETETDH